MADLALQRTSLFSDPCDYDGKWGGGAIHSPMWAPKSAGSQGLTVSDLADRKGTGKLHEAASGTVT